MTTQIENLGSEPKPRTRAFATYGRTAVELVDDSLALDFRRGDWPVMKPVSRLVRDPCHGLKSGEVVRMQQIRKQTVFETRGDGSEERNTVAEWGEIIAGHAARILKGARV